MAALEGKEIEGKIGDIGEYSLDVGLDGFVEVKVGIKVDIIAELEKLALRSDNKIDDAIIKIVKGALGR